MPVTLSHFDDWTKFIFYPMKVFLDAATTATGLPACKVFMREHNVKIIKPPLCYPPFLVFR